MKNFIKPMSLEKHEIEKLISKQQLINPKEYLRNYFKNYKAKMEKEAYFKGDANEFKGANIL